MARLRLLPSLPLAVALAVTLTVALAACDTATPVSDCVPGVDPSCPTPEPPDDVVAGVDLRALFATPAASELDAALARSPSSTPGQTSLAALPDGADGSRRYLLALDQGPDRVVTALVRVPGPAGAVATLPVVVVLPDGASGASAADLLTASGYGALPDRTIQVVLAYRGEPLEVSGGAVASGVAADPYRADLADVRALLGGLSLIPRAEAGRVALVGLGRGGTVALLTAPGTTVDAVVTLGAPTDLFATSFVDEVRARLRGATPAAPFPALDALAAPAFALRDGTLTRAEARVELLVLSPARLRPAERLPPLLALHGASDTVVGIDQLQRLASALGGRGVAALVENESHASLPQAPAVQNQVASFLLNTL